MADLFDTFFKAYNFALTDSLHDMGPKMNDGADTRAVVDETRPTTPGGGSYVGKVVPVVFSRSMQQIKITILYLIMFFIM